jgi:multidrug efflux pump subunit AcrA (membrane-fusion protein)
MKTKTNKAKDRQHKADQAKYTAQYARTEANKARKQALRAERLERNRSAKLNDPFYYHGISREWINESARGLRRAA